MNLNKPPLVFVDRRTSEIIKYAANAFLATKITFINEIADLCEKVGANVQDVARGIGMDNRIGAKFLHAGPGYGGSCFPKDTLALVKTGQDADAPMRIVETVAAINDQRKRGMAKKVIAACGGSVRGKTIGLLGLAFKPNTDDMRDAPSLALALALEDAGAQLRVYDPGGDGASRAASRERRVLHRRLRLRDRGGGAGDRHRMGHVPRARLRAAGAADERENPGRPAQRLQRRRRAPPRLRLFRRRRALEANAGLRAELPCGFATWRCTPTRRGAPFCNARQDSFWAIMLRIASTLCAASAGAMSRWLTVSASANLPSSANTSAKFWRTRASARGSVEARRSVSSARSRFLESA